MGELVRSVVISLVCVTTLCVGSSYTFAQTSSLPTPGPTSIPMDPPCIPRPLEDYIYPEELEDYFAPDIRGAGLAALRAWNETSGAKINEFKPSIMRAFRLKQRSPNYAQYRAMVLFKLELFENFNIASCLEIPGMPTSRSARKRAVEAEFAAFEKQISEPAAAGCSATNLYESCLCKLTSLTQSCNSEYAKMAALCAQVPLKERVIRSSGQSSCSLSCAGSKLYPSRSCSCEDIAGVYVTASDGSCQPMEVIPNRDRPQRCVRDEPITINPREVLEPKLCLDIDGVPGGIPENVRCGDISALLSSVGTSALSPRIRRAIVSSMSDIDKGLSVSYGSCASPSYPAAQKRDGDSKDGSGGEGKDGSTTDPKDPGQSLEDLAKLSESQQVVVDTTAMLRLPTIDVPEGYRVEENPDGLNPYDQVRLHNERRSAGILNAREAVTMIDGAIGALIADIEQTREEKKQAILAMREIAAKSRIYEEKKIRALYWKTGTSIVLSGVGLFTKVSPFGITMTIVGLVVPTTVGRIVGPSDDRLIGLVSTGVGNTVKELGKTVVKGLPAGKYKGMGAGYFAAMRAAAFVAIVPQFNSTTKAAAQIAQESRTLSTMLRMFGGAVKVCTAERTQVAKGVGKAGGMGVSLLFSWNDAESYVKRDFTTDNPYEAMLRQQEQGIRGINQRMAQQRQFFSDLLSVREQWIERLRVAYCLDPRDAGYERSGNKKPYNWGKPDWCR